MKMTPSTLAFLDFETTGLHPARGDRPTEVAVVFLRDGKIVDRFERLMHPGRSIPAHITELTGISNSMVKHQPEASTVIAELHARIHGSLVIAHNAKFERSFLESEYRRIGIRTLPRLHCSWLIARRLCRGPTNHKLQTLASHFGLSFSGPHHRAMPDAEMTAQVWIKMACQLQKEYGLQECPYQLMTKLQKVAIDNTSGYISKFVERLRAKKKVSDETNSGTSVRHVPNRKVSKEGRIGTSVRGAPKPTARAPSDRTPPAQVRNKVSFREIPIELLPENAVTRAKQPTLHVTAHRRSIATSRRTEGTMDRARASTPTVKCMRCKRRISANIEDSFPFVKCHACGVFTAKRLCSYNSS